MNSSLLDELGGGGGRQRHASAGHMVTNPSSAMELSLHGKKDDSEIPDDLDMALSALKDCDNDFSKFVEQSDGN